MTNETALDPPRSAPAKATTVAEQTALSDRPLGEILANLWQNFETAVRQELELASAELDEKTSRLKRDATAAVIAGAVLYAGVLATAAALILLLSRAVAPWLAALLVGVVAMGARYALLKRHHTNQSLAAATGIRSTNDIPTSHRRRDEPAKEHRNQRPTPNRTAPGRDTHCDQQ
jgi:hypothetical protein